MCIVVSFLRNPPACRCFLQSVRQGSLPPNFVDQRRETSHWRIQVTTLPWPLILKAALLKALVRCQPVKEVPMIHLYLLCRQSQPLLWTLLLMLLLALAWILHKVLCQCLLLPFQSYMNLAMFPVPFSVGRQSSGLIHRKLVLLLWILVSWLRPHSWLLMLKNFQNSVQRHLPECTRNLTHQPVMLLIRKVAPLQCLSRTVVCSRGFRPLQTRMCRKMMVQVPSFWTRRLYHRLAFLWVCILSLLLLSYCTKQI